MLNFFQINYLSSRTAGRNVVNRNPYDEQASLLDDSQEATVVSKSRHLHRTLQIIDLALNAFVLAPLIIIYWVSTWDIIFLHIYPSNLVYSYTSTILVANVIIFGSYATEERLQLHHDRLRDFENSSIDDDPGDRPRRSYYGRDFFFRLVYIYFVTVAYIFQWRAFWDLFNFATRQANYGYFVAISVVTLLAHRFILRKSFGKCVKTTPFYLKIDTKFDDFFLQRKPVSCQNKWAEIVANYIFNEFIEMGISVIMWKGIYDLFDFGTIYLASGSPAYSLLISGTVGYGLYVLVLAVDVAWSNQRRSAALKELLFLLAYFGMVGVWRTCWVGFDLLVLKSDQAEWLVFVVHYTTLIVTSSLKLMSSLVGPSA